MYASSVETEPVILHHPVTPPLIIKRRFFQKLKAMAHFQDLIAARVYNSLNKPKYSDFNITPLSAFCHQQIVSMYRKIRRIDCL
jgi:hypothetical protein